MNIAGAVPQVNLFEMTDKQWDDSMQVKFHSARRLSIQAWPHLRQTRAYIKPTFLISMTISQKYQTASRKWYSFSVTL
ncbi:hypothetical protein [Dyadobacter sp. CY261]|uniref:hypothetical protein n=1 Tax=Dyadobacter sp. CY261 TaxID=2907203 RepID=UPI0038D3565C